MNGSGHVQVGFASGLAVGSVAGWPLWRSVAAGVVAAALSRLPDVDNRRWWQTADTLLPDEALGHGGPMRHRGVTHWWAWPVLLAVVSQLGVSAAGVDVGWLVLAAAVGLGSHVVADFVFGAKSKFRDAGVPLFPWWGHVGVGLKSDGITAQITAPVTLAAVVVWVTGLAGPIATAIGL